MLEDPIADATKKLGDNLDIVNNIKKNLENLDAVGKSLLNDVGSFQDKLFSTVRKDLGLMGVGVDKFDKGLMAATSSVVKLGGNLTDVITYFTAINKSLGRTTFLTEQAAINFRQLALVGVSDEAIGKLNKFFDSVGLGIEDSTQKQKNLVEDCV